MALTALELRARYEHEVVWLGVTARVLDEPAPPRAVFVGLMQAMPAALPLPSAATWLTGALRQEFRLRRPTAAEDMELPCATLVRGLTRQRAWLRRALKRVPDAEVYRGPHRARMADASSAI
jgi:hypothetical protein